MQGRCHNDYIMYVCCVLPDTDLCRVAPESNVTMVTVNLEDINDNAPVFEGDSLLAAVAEEAELDTTVTIIKVSISYTLPSPPTSYSSFYACSIPSGT